MSRRINRLFAEYHGKYDLANKFYSMGIDRSWRSAAAEEAIIGRKRYKLLDIATGTAELAIMTAVKARERGKEISITGIDFSREMLWSGRKKVAADGLGNIVLKRDDALHMKFPDSSFDVATCAFALRNFDDLEGFFNELRRVLKRGGKFVILEMANPDNALQRSLFNIYFGGLMRPFGYAIGKDAYKWLLYSVSHFERANVVRMLKAAGFRNVRSRPLRTGVAFIATGIR